MFPHRFHLIVFFVNDTCFHTVAVVSKLVTPCSFNSNSTLYFLSIYNFYIIHTQTIYIHEKRFTFIYSLDSTNKKEHWMQIMKNYNIQLRSTLLHSTLYIQFRWEPDMLTGLLLGSWMIVTKDFYTQNVINLDFCIAKSMSTLSLIQLKIHERSFKKSLNVIFY